MLFPAAVHAGVLCIVGGYMGIGMQGKSHDNKLCVYATESRGQWCLVVVVRVCVCVCSFCVIVELGA